MPGADLLFIRFCLTGPLLYIGLQMILVPARFVRSLRMLVCVLHDFQHRFEAFQRREPLCHPGSIVVTDKVQLAVRAAGMALAVCSLLFLSGVTEQF